jgi:hypothetical protein
LRWVLGQSAAVSGRRCQSRSMTLTVVAARVASVGILPTGVSGFNR